MKLLRLLFVFALFFSFAGCGSKAEKKEKKHEDVVQSLNIETDEKPSE